MDDAHPHDVTDELRAMLRDQGLRATAARLSVLRVLHERRAPMTHEDIMGVLDDGLADKASVWRLLSDLADQGILRRMDLGDRVWRYELLDACRPVESDHGHFLCESCGTVLCLPPLKLVDPSGAVPSVLAGADYRVRLAGRCGRCTA
jgi:Fur family ferric uptake transcriptional regulator